MSGSNSRSSVGVEGSAVGEDGDVPAPVRPVRVESSGSATLKCGIRVALLAPAREGVDVRGVEGDLEITSLITRAGHEMFSTVVEQSPN